MIVAITIILIVAMICGSCLLAYYWSLISVEVNEYTLRDVQKTVQRIEELLRKQYLEQLKEQK